MGWGEEGRFEICFGWGMREREETRTPPRFWGAGGSIPGEGALHLQSLLGTQMRCHVSERWYDFRGQGRSQTFFNAQIILAAQ